MATQIGTGVLVHQVQNKQTTYIQRSIYFYKAKLEEKDASGASISFSAHQFGKRLVSIAAGADSYHRYENGDRQTVWVEETPTHDWEVTFGKSRRSALPHVEENRQKKPLALSGDEGLLEQIHVIIFNDGIVGAEYNMYAPRLHSLSEYVQAKDPNGHNVLFVPLLSTDTLKRLNDLTEVKWFKFGFGEKASSNLIDSPLAPLNTAFRDLLSGHEAPSYEVLIRAPKYSRQSMLRSVAGRVLDLFADSRVMATAETAKLEGYSDRTHHREFFDLLRDQIMVKRKVVRQNGDYKAIDSSDMFQKIREARKDLDDPLKDAAAAIP